MNHFYENRDFDSHGQMMLCRLIRLSLSLLRQRSVFHFDFFVERPFVEGDSYGIEMHVQHF